MLDYFSNHPVTTSVIGSLIVAVALVCAAWLRKKAQRIPKRRQRGLVIRDATGRFVPDCEVVYGDTRARHKSDRRGYVPIPQWWPVKVRVDIEYKGNCLLRDVQCDYKSADKCEVILPFEVRPEEGNQDY